MTAPTIAEEKLLEEFRHRVCDILKLKEQREDIYLIRWLRARDLDLNKAEEMLRASVIWREENNVDKILEVKFDSFFLEEYPYYVKGIDKYSHPVVFTPVGKWDLRKVANLGKSEDFKLYVSYFFEDVCRSIRERNKNRDRSLFPVTQFTVIMDWSGYSYMQLMSIKAVQNILHSASVYEAHYPEILFKCFFVNCPSFFHILFALIKPLLAQKTYEKISVYGSDQSEWEQAILEIIDCDQLGAIFNNCNLKSVLLN